MRTILLRHGTVRCCTPTQRIGNRVQGHLLYLAPFPKAKPSHEKQTAMQLQLSMQQEGWIAWTDDGPASGPPFLVPRGPSQIKEESLVWPHAQIPAAEGWFLTTQLAELASQSKISP